MKTTNEMQEAKTEKSVRIANTNRIKMEVKEINIDILSDYNNLHRMYYSVEDVPPFHLSFLFGMQVYFSILFCAVSHMFIVY